MARPGGTYPPYNGRRRAAPPTLAPPPSPNDMNPYHIVHPPARAPSATANPAGPAAGTTYVAFAGPARIYVQGLPYMQDDAVARELLHGIFGCYGIVNVRLGDAPPSARLRSRPDCYAWLALESSAAVAAAVADLHGAVFEWGRLFVLACTD